MSMAHGHGVYINTMGDTYTGNWRFDKKHGKGREFWTSDKSVYDGEYFKGEREGFGTFSVNGRVVYEGSWKKGKMHGKGKHSMVDREYTGDFQDGVFQGFGIMRQINNDNLYEGEFREGLREGYGA